MDEQELSMDHSTEGLPTQHTPRKRMSPTEAAARLTRAFILMTVLTVKQASDKADVNIATASRYIKFFIKEGMIVRMHDLEEGHTRIYRWVGVE